MILRDSVKIEAAPEAVFGFFEDMESNYLEWHPDHVVFQWVSGRGLKEGNAFYFEEYIRGKLFKKRVAFTRITPGRHIEFAPTFWLMRFFLPRMLFRMEPQPGGCEFIAEIHLRLGPLARRANAKDLDAVREHMRVEGVNIKRIVEARADGSLGEGE